MRRLLPLALLAALAAFGAPADAWIAQKGGGAPPPATTSQLLFSSGGGNLSNSAANYIPVGFSMLAVTTDSNLSIFAAPGNITAIRARVVGAPSGAATWVFTLRKNGSDTALACTIDSASSSKCTASSSIAFAAGDYASIRITPNSSPGATRGSAVLIFEPTTANDTVIFAQGLAFSTSATQAVSISSNAGPGAASARRYNVFPDGGTVDKFYVNANAPGAGKNYAYTVDKGGTTTAVTCSIADTATACNDTANSFSVTGSSGSTAGDDVQIQAAPTGTPASATAALGVRYVPTTAARFALILAPSNADNATSIFYYPLTGGSGIGTSTESQNQNIAASMTVEKIAVKLSAAPGAGKSRLFTLRKNEADTALACTIADTDTSCTATGSIAVSDDDRLDTSDAPTGTPATAQPAISYLASR